MRQENLSQLRPDHGVRSSDGGRYTVGLARSESEVQEAQALRFQVFAGEMGAILGADSCRLALDADRFDVHCEHLIVRDNCSLDVVGTYRILTPDGARRCGGYYSETEFDLSSLTPIRAGLLEVGRSCIHPDHRGGAVLTLLWSGLATYMRERKFAHLAGCASVSLADGGILAAGVLKSLCDNHLSPPEYRVIPRQRASLPPVDPGTPMRMPPLIKGYLRAGAHICGEPAWDADFNTADMFLLLPIAGMSQRYAQHFRVDTTTKSNA